MKYEIEHTLKGVEFTMAEVEHALDAARSSDAHDNAELIFEPGNKYGYQPYKAIVTIRWDTNESP